MLPWEQPIPPILYKYLRPGRLDVLADCRVRFSQRTIFDDDHELQPDYAAFGTEEQIQKFMVSWRWPEVMAKWLSPLIAATPSLQEIAKRTAQQNMKSVNQFGVFCLSEVADSEQMWTEYAEEGSGFVIAFDTTHAGFEQLKTPGRIGKVSYSDEPVGSFLGALEDEGAGIFFRKRMKYCFEKEWRSIRALHRLEHCAGDVYLSPFDPASVREVIISRKCALETDLTQVVLRSGRYQRARIVALHEL